MTNLKTILLDMDGTLLNSNGKITQLTKDTLIKLQENGVRLVLASGRSTSGILDYAKELKMEQYDGYLISYNGACIYSMHDKKDLWEEVLPRKEAKKILRHLENFDVIPMVGNKGYIHVAESADPYVEVFGKRRNIIHYEAKAGNYLIKKVENLADFVDFSPRKVLVLGNEDYINQNYKKMRAPFVDIHTSVSTGPNHYEYTSNKADKGLAFDELKKILQLNSKQSMAFVDGYNDISLIERVGTSIAMDNAVQDIKDLTDHVCESNNDDGIAKFLRNNLEI